MTIVTTFLLFLLSIMIKQGGTINNKLKTIIGLIIYITLPIILGLIVVKAIKDYNGILVFESLVLLSVTLSIVRLIRYNKYKKNKFES